MSVIRKPTTHEALYAFHAALLSGGPLPCEYSESDPQCGWYRTRLRRDGPFVPVRLFINQEIDGAGELTAPEVVVGEMNGAPMSADAVIHRWPYLKPITEDAFWNLVNLHQKDSRMAATHVAIDLAQEPMRP